MSNLRRLKDGTIRSMQQSILIVEDDEAILDFLIEFLKEEGYIVQGTPSGTEGIRAIEKNAPDLILLDLALPDIPGEEVLGIVKKNYPELPVVILTAKSKVEQVVKGLNLGADDYLSKPFSVEELLARIKARLRTGQNDTSQLIIEDLVVNTNTREAFRNSHKIDLTKTEFDLLVHLMLNANKVQTRDMLLNHIWGYTSDVESRVVDVYIGYLRQKVDSSFDRKFIHSIRGVGYILKTSM